jgi:hypothetical protein
MEVMLSALRAGSPLPSGRFLVLISVRVCVDPIKLKPRDGLIINNVKIFYAPTENNFKTTASGELTRVTNEPPPRALADSI